MVALVTGATGFVGREVVKALLSRGVEVRCFVRTPGSERVLGSGLDVHYGDVRDPAALRAAFYDVDVVVHLVAIIRERGTLTLDGINHRGTENVVEAAAGVGVSHFIHQSALGAREDPAYAYLYSKWQGEQAVIRSGLPYTILRPSVIFGPGDEFVNLLASLAKAFPIVPIPGTGRNRFQPLAVDEMARCLAETTGREDLIGRVIELGGPEHLPMDDLVDTIARTCNVRRLKVHVPQRIMRLAVKAMAALTGRAPATQDQLRSMAIPNVAGLNTVEETFGFRPRPVAGNIDYVKRIGFRDALKSALTGSMPAHIGDG
ncbi:MAG: complex I NDUFA9 subunit family protein [Dehalococcoidia bacterium]|nr:complex I NDUFA9 subunit family protein [Dehalococcoidia bacterium]